MYVCYFAYKSEIKKLVNERYLLNNVFLCLHFFGLLYKQNS